MSKFYQFKVPKNQKIWHLRFMYSMGIISLHTPTKMSLAVVLRGQSSFNNHEFTRNGFCDFLPHPGYFRVI